MRNGELEQYYWRLKRDADAFLKYGGDQGGGGHGAGSLLFEEIRRVVGSYARRQQLDAERFDDLFVYYAKFLLGEKPHISTVFQLADDLAGVRRGLRVQFGRFLTRHIHASAIGRLTDNLVDGLEMRFFGFGLTRHGSKSGVYWSESERGPDEQAQIRGALGDVESRLGEALRLALRDLRPLTNERRLASGYGDASRDRLASLFRENLRVEAPGVGGVAFIEKRLVEQVLRVLIRAQFPELVSIRLVPPPHENEDGDVFEEQEQPGLERPELEDAMGAVESVLAVMEELTFDARPLRLNGTSGADVREVVRLYTAGVLASNDGETTSRDVEAALAGVAARAPGDRPLDLKNMMEALPSRRHALDAVSDADLRRRIERLLEEFRNPTRRPAARSHVTVQKLLERFRQLWKRETVDLGPAASADAHRWLFDLLFLEVGQYPPDDSGSGPGAALVEGREEWEASAS